MDHPDTAAEGRQPPLRLVPIDRSGLPVERAFELSEAAYDACRACGLLYELYGFEPPWIGYLARRGDAYVGACAFKAPPADGAVEIAFQTFAGHTGRGHAGAMAAALCEIVAATGEPIAVIAATPPEEHAAGRVLRRLGFVLRGPVHHPEDGPIWRWEWHPPRAGAATASRERSHE